jgi:FlaA1/EpsC-like NDP-sugar epimerase
MEGLAGVAAVRTGERRAAVRLVNVLGSGGSASELFLRQARAGVPLTVTDTGMLRYWITMAHAAALVGQTILPGPSLVTAAQPAMLTVGELAARIWRGAGGGAEPDFHVMGVRPGETMDEVLSGTGERLGGEVWSGVAEIEPAGSVDDGTWRTDPASLAALVEEAERHPGSEDRRAVWMRALGPTPVTAA